MRFFANQTLLSQKIYNFATVLWNKDIVVAHFSDESPPQKR